MFDNLREDAAASPFYEEEAKFQPAAGTSSPSYSGAKPKRFLGMTAPQRFVIVFMLAITVCLLGTMLLLVTGKIAI
jgi:hypothetical protein